MMSEPTTKPTIVDATVSPGSGATSDRPTANANDASSSSPAAPSEPVEEPVVNGDETSLSSAAVSSAAAAASRKRVFTFQKRWLHTLPIMEKVLPDSALDAASVVALRAANLLGDDGKPVDDAGARDVVVCMLCDDPSASREPLKLWSRLNCRRGRIENHLMSKHPEFMLLLKQKRESEGDLAVQIFLQNMREGRCNVRHEISAGLYSHLQSGMPSSVELAQNKRAFAHDEFMMPTATSMTAVAVAKPPQVQGTVSQDVGSDPTLDAEARRKRVKANGTGDATVTTTAAAVGEPDGNAELLGVSLLSYHGPAAFSQWTNLMANKMIVVTGGEMAAIARVATNLWLVGANVLVTFAEQAPMEAFAASYLTQFHAAGSMEPPRGIMLPLYCSLRSRSEIEEWSRSIATKFGHVDFLLNFVHNDASRENPVSVNANRCRELCEVFSGACMQRSSRNAIINMVCEAESGRESDDTCAAVEELTKSMSLQLRAINVQVNTLVLQQPGAVPANTGDEDIELIHLILFLLSPASACVSGSVLCHQRRLLVPASRAATVNATASVPTAVAATPSHATTATQPGDTTSVAISNGVELETHVI